VLKLEIFDVEGKPWVFLNREAKLRRPRKFSIFTGFGFLRDFSGVKKQMVF
jgi:hypothetical protein